MNKQKTIIIISVSLTIIILIAVALALIGRKELAKNQPPVPPIPLEEGWEIVEDWGGPQSKPYTGPTEDPNKLPAEIKGKIVTLAEKFLVIERSNGALEVPYNINEVYVYKEKGGQKEKIDDASVLKLGVEVTVIMNETRDKAIEIIVQ